MRRGIGKAWPWLLSLVGHGAALLALTFFFLHSPASHPSSPTPHIGVGAHGRPEVPVEEADDPEPSRDPVFTGGPPPEPRVPDARPEPVALPTEDASSLPPLDIEEPAWVEIDVPLSVASRRVKEVQRSPPPKTKASRSPRPPRLRLPRLRPIHAPQYYPRAAIRARLEGVVRVEVTIHTSGVVMGVRLLESSGHQVLDSAALASARQWRFAPIPETRRAELPFRFDL